jgi:hypothetical protein
MLKHHANSRIAFPDLKAPCDVWMIHLHNDLKFPLEHLVPLYPILRDRLYCHELVRGVVYSEINRPIRALAKLLTECIVLPNVSCLSHNEKVLRH